MSFKPNGLITLLSDFGLQDPFVGCVKGVIAASAPDVRVIDLSHEIPPQDVDAAGFWLSRSFRYFPAGTVHVAVVDPGVGSDRGLLLATVENQCLLAPDNGLLAPLLALPGTRARLLSSNIVARFSLPSTSATFHGRDVFAPVASALASGKLDPEAVGDKAERPVQGGVPPVIMSPGQVQGQVVVVDRFGNLITNIDASMIGEVKGLEAWIGQHRMGFCHSYYEAAEGEIFALINSFGVIEIARRNDSAARRLKLAKNALVQVTRRTE